MGTPEVTATVRYARRPDAAAVAAMTPPDTTVSYARRRDAPAVASMQSLSQARLRSDEALQAVKARLYRKRCACHPGLPPPNRRPTAEEVAAVRAAVLGCGGDLASARSAALETSGDATITLGSLVSGASTAKLDSIVPLDQKPNPNPPALPMGPLSPAGSIVSLPKGPKVVPEPFGRWVRMQDAPGLFIHVAVLPSGRLLGLGGSQYSGAAHQVFGTQLAYVYDPTLDSRYGTPPRPGAWTNLLPPVAKVGSGPHRNPYGETVDAFCAGMAHDFMGNVVFAGGWYDIDPETGNARAGTRRSAYFTAFAGATIGAWTQLGDLPESSYYPTLIQGVDAMIAFGANNDSLRHPIWRMPIGATDWSPTNALIMSTNEGVYVRAHVVPDGRVFVVTGDYSRNRSSVLFDPSTNGVSSVSAAPELLGLPVYGHHASSSVLLPIVPNDGHNYTMASVLVTGTDRPMRIDLPIRTPGRLAIPNSKARWQVAGVGLGHREHGTATLLPTGQVFVSGGIAAGVSDAGANLTTDVYGVDDDGRLRPEWFAAPPATHPRNYHSVAILLPDGRVWTHGGNRNSVELQQEGPDTRNRDVQIFEPWYFGRPDRPVIETAPTYLAIGQAANLRVGRGEANLIERVSLVRLGAMTHAFDSDQRLVFLDFTRRNTSEIRVAAPYTQGAAPPGWYMLFILKRQGAGRPLIPSTGWFVLIPPVALADATKPWSRKG